MNIIYIRTSTEDQNPKNQLADIHTMVNDAEIFKDQQSAWRDHKERAGFESIKKLIKGRKISNLYVWDVDRIYRNRLNLISFFKLCKIYECKIHSYRQKWLETINAIQPPFNEIMHDLMIQIMGWMAEEESIKKSDRVKAAVRKSGQVTKSYKGNKWGRKTISTQKRNKIKFLRDRGNTIRKIAAEVGLSTGVVHKYIVHMKQEEN